MITLEMKDLLGTGLIGDRRTYWGQANYYMASDGIATTTTWTDLDLPARTHTRYHISLLATTGAESNSTIASPATSPWSREGLSWKARWKPK
jgi:hypothetical protein